MQQLIGNSHHDASNTKKGEKHNMEDPVSNQPLDQLSTDTNPIPRPNALEMSNLSFRLATRTLAHLFKCPFLIMPSKILKPKDYILAHHMLETASILS